MTTIHDLYGDFWARENPAFARAVEESLNPRKLDMLYSFFADLGVSAGDRVLDIGCRDAVHSVQLVRQLDCRCIAVDVIPVHVQMAREKVAREGLGNRIEVREGSMEAIPIEDAAVDYIWCRDMLNHVALPAGMKECFRVLRPGGAMMVYATFATALLEPVEARRLFEAAAIVPENMSPRYFERTVLEAGFSIVNHDRIDSEWREASLEAGEKGLPEALLRISRMRRQADRLIQEHGRGYFEAAYAGDLWGIYQILGKLCPTLYVLNK